MLCEVADFFFGANLENYVEGFLGISLGSLGLIRPESEILGEKISELIASRLIKRLKRLEDKRRLGFPLLGSSIKLGCSFLHLLRLSALSTELLRPCLSILELLGHGSKIACDVAHTLHFFSCMQRAKGIFDIHFDPGSEEVMRLGTVMGGLEYPIPRRLKYAASRLAGDISRLWG